MSEKVQKVQEEHKSITLTIEIDGENKRFVTPKKINGTLFRVAASVEEDLNSGLSVLADLDSHLQFVCDVFGNQFSIDELESGVDSRDLLKIVFAMCYFVSGQVSLASELLLKNVDLSTQNDEKKT